MSPHAPRTSPLVACALGLAAGLLASGPVRAQQVSTRTPVEAVRIGGRVHTQLNTSSVAGQPGSELRLRRMRVELDARVNDWIDGALQADFGDGGAAVRFAFLRLSPSPALRASFGQFKRAFDLFELTSSADILVVERAGGVRGVDTCTGVGGLCSYSRFTEELRHSSYDVGMLLEGALAAGRLSYLVSLTNGTGAGVREENGAKSVAARLAWGFADDLKLGASLGLHDFSNPVTEADEHAPAAALELEWGTFAGGPHVQAGLIQGDNWRNLSQTGEASRFRAAQVILTYRQGLEGRRVAAVEPLARFSWGDPDLNVEGDQGVLLTPGVMVHLSGRNKLAANVDVWSPSTGDREWSFKLQTYLHF